MVTRNEMVEMLGGRWVDRRMGTIDPDDLTGEDLDLMPNNRACKTYTGVAFDLFDQSTWEFRREDIARSLSNACRFAGHINFRSVGSHCIDVSRMLRDRGEPAAVQLLGLLHDASEAYLLDIPRPWKQEVYIDGVSYIDREKDLEKAIFHWAGPAVEQAFQTDWHKIKEADLDNFLIERASRAKGARKLPFVHPNACMNAYLLLWDQLEQEASKV